MTWQSIECNTKKRPERKIGKKRSFESEINRKSQVHYEIKKSDTNRVENHFCM